MEGLIFGILRQLILLVYHINKVKFRNSILKISQNLDTFNVQLKTYHETYNLRM